NGLEEWMLIDMQGEINNSGRPFDEEMLCNLGWRKDNSEALMLIGHHLVEGKVINLEKPYIVAAPKDQDGKKVLYAEAVVRRKLVFKLRPKPIVTKHLMKRGQYDKMNEQEKENEE
ncbi:hypothetical protein PENTCL1PPCAC_22646, partial [Pristionchus entomophagus]